jgi:hypothetical protein
MYFLIKQLPFIKVSLYFFSENYLDLTEIMIVNLRSPHVADDNPVSRMKGFRYILDSL